MVHKSLRHPCAGHKGASSKKQGVIDLVLLELAPPTGGSCASASAGASPVAVEAAASLPSAAPAWDRRQVPTGGVCASTGAHSAPASAAAVLAGPCVTSGTCHWLRWRSARCWELYAREGYLLRQGPSLDMMPRHLVPCRLCGAREGGYLPLGEYLPLVGKPRLSNPQEGGTKLRLASHPCYSNRCCSEQGRAPGSASLTWLATLVVIPIGVAPSKVGLQGQRH